MSSATACRVCGTHSELGCEATGDEVCPYTDRLCNCTPDRECGWCKAARLEACRPDPDAQREAMLDERASR